MIRFIYSLLTYLLFPFVKKRLKKRFDKNYLKSRMWNGKYKKEVFDYIIHGASVGEQMLLTPLISKLSSSGYSVLLTVATETGYEIAKKYNQNTKNVKIEYLPFDLYYSVKRFFKFRFAKKLILTETELWINLIEEAYKNNIEITLINGRISDSSFKTYKKLNFMFKNSIKKISQCLVRFDLDGDRLIEMGIDKTRVKVMGNLKLAMNPMVKEFKFSSPKPVVIFASTRDGEEEIILANIKDFINSQKISVIFAPRHPNRAEYVETLCKKNDYKVIFSKGNEEININNNEILIVNETGKLLSFYKQIDLAFVGGSLVDFGGQNFIEPIFFEKPVITGKFLGNFQDILPIFKDFITIVENGEQLNKTIKNFLDSSDEFKKRAKESKIILNKQQKALEICFKEITNADK